MATKLKKGKGDTEFLVPWKNRESSLNTYLDTVTSH